MSTTAGRGSSLTSISSRASLATAGLAATTAATGSPTYRATPAAMGHLLRTRTPGLTPSRGNSTLQCSLASSPESTASTPGCWRALDGSTARRQAWGWGLRSTAM
jgi:hypothetical protein